MIYRAYIIDKSDFEKMVYERYSLNRHQLELEMRTAYVRLFERTDPEYRGCLEQVFETIPPDTNLVSI